MPALWRPRPNLSVLRTNGTWRSPITSAPFMLCLPIRRRTRPGSRLLRLCGIPIRTAQRSSNSRSSWQAVRARAVTSRGTTLSAHLHDCSRGTRMPGLTRSQSTHSGSGTTGDYLVDQHRSVHVPRVRGVPLRERADHGGRIYRAGGRSCSLQRARRIASSGQEDVCVIRCEAGAVRAERSRGLPCEPAPHSCSGY